MIVMTDARVIFIARLDIIVFKMAAKKYVENQKQLFHFLVQSLQLQQLQTTVRLNACLIQIVQLDYHVLKKDATRLAFLNNQFQLCPFRIASYHLQLPHRFQVNVKLMSAVMNVKLIKIVLLDFIVGF